MAVFSASDPVVVGLSTKADHYHRVFDNTVALQEGSVALTKVTLDGQAIAPSLSASGDAVMYYDTNEDQLMVSKNGSAFGAIGKFPLNDPNVAGGTAFGFGS